MSNLTYDEQRFATLENWLMYKATDEQVFTLVAAFEQFADRLERDKWEEIATDIIYGAAWAEFIRRDLSHTKISAKYGGSKW